MNGPLRRRACARCSPSASVVPRTALPRRAAPSVRRGRRACRACRQCRQCGIDDEGRAADRLRRRRDRRGRLVRDGAAGLCHARGDDRQRRRPNRSQRSHDCSRPAERASGAGSRSRHQRPGGGRRVERAGASDPRQAEALVPVAPAPPARAPERAERTEAPVAASTLAAEVAALERAQTALAAHDAPGALRALDHYEAAFPSGRLVREETVLRVQALLARGDADAARALAERFFAAHPDSSYARRVRELLHDAREPRKKE